MRTILSSRERRLLVGLVVVFAVLLFLEFRGSWLFDPDETRYAEVPREMLATSDYLTPRLNGSVYFEKPPLLYWLNAGSMKLFGETPFAARLPTRLATVGTALLLIVCLTSSAAPSAGLWAALVFLSAPLSFALGRINLTDGVLTFSLTWAFFALRAYLQRTERGRRTWPVEIALGTGVALAVLSKGLIGIVFPGMVFVSWVAIHGKWRLIPKLLFSWAPVVCLAVAAPWFLMVENVNPGFSWFFFIHEHFLRYTTDVSERPGPVYYFVVTFLLGFLPWLFLFVKASRPFLTFKRKAWRARPDESFFLIWFLSILVFFSLSHSKLIPYILPAFPAAAALTGLYLAAEPRPWVLWKIQAPFYLLMAVGIAVAATVTSGFFVKYGLSAHALVIALFFAGIAGAGAYFSKESGLRGRAAPLLFWAGIYFVLVHAVPRLAREYSDHNLAATAVELPFDSGVCYESFSNSFPWIQKGNVIVAKFSGEFPSIGTPPPALFWNHDEFFKRWDSSQRLAVILRKSSLRHFDALRNKPVVLATNRRSALIVNFETEAKKRLTSLRSGEGPARLFPRFGGDPRKDSTPLG